MITQINSAAGGWWNWMWPMLWQVSVLIVFIGAVDFLLRKRIWPQVRYALWLLVLVKLILPPTYSLSTSVVSQVRMLASRSVSQLSDTHMPADLSAVGADLEIAPLAMNGSIEPAPDRNGMMSSKAAEPAGRVFSTGVTASVERVGLHWKVYVMAVWLAGVIVLGLWAAVRFRKLRQLHSGKFSDADLPEWFGTLFTKTAKKLGLRKLPVIVLSQNIASPAVFGMFRPVIVLPADTVRHLSQNRTEHILLHELAHIKRGDLLVNALYMLLQIVYWFNPLLWLLRRRLQHLRELCCDATVAGILRDKTMDYRETILQNAKWLLTGPARSGMGLLGLAEDSNNLLVRLDWLEKKTWKYRGLRIVTVCAAIALMAACVLPMAKTRAKTGPSDKSLQAAQLDPDSQSGGRATNTVRGFVTDKLGRPRGNVYIATSLNNLRNAIMTDESGQFTLEVMQPQQKTWIAYCQPIRSVGLFNVPKDYAGQPIHVALSFYLGEAEGRVVGSDGKGLADRRIELITNIKQDLTYYSESYGKTDTYGNYRAGALCGANATVRARLADADVTEQKYITDAVTLSDNQIFFPIPTLVIGEGQPGKTDDGKVLCSGRVVNEEGRPVHGTRVKLYFDMPGWMSTSVRSLMVDEHGLWKRRLPKDLSNLRIRLLHPEYIAQRQSPSLAELHNGTHVMAMKRGLRLSGVVRNQRAEPVENALIDTGGGDGTTPYGEVMENWTTPRTLADGSFSIGGLPESSKDIVVSAVGYAPQVIRIEIEEGMEPITISLKSGRTYVGQIVNIDGNPVEGVEIDVDDWKIGGRSRSMIRVTKTDSQGNFTVDNLPVEGRVILDLGKRDSGLLGIRKEIPEDVSRKDKIVMFKVPVFVGKVVDAETGEAIQNFILINGIGSSSLGDSVDWSRYGKQKVTSEDGTFSRRWGGPLMTYPFDGLCCLRVEATGYLPEAVRPMKLGEKYEPCVVRLTKAERAESLRGEVIDQQGNPAAKAQVGWAGPERIAFIKNGKFDITGFSNQAEPIVNTYSNGVFELPPTREQGLIVVVHKTGYASVASKDFKNGSQIRLTPWARIEGTIVSSRENRGEFVLSIYQAIPQEELEYQQLRWLFDRTSFTGNNFVIDFVPSTPLNIGRVVKSGQYDPVYIDPQPGGTCEVRFGDEGIIAAGKKMPSLLDKPLPDLTGIETDFSPAQHKGKMILLCFWDMNQRPSRNCISQLAGRSEQLGQKGVTIVAIQASKVDENTLDQWAKKYNISFPSGIIGVDEKETLFAWGVKSLPWLILTDRKHIVRAEGFGLSELDLKYKDPYMEKLKASAEKRPGASRTRNFNTTPVSPSDIALLYHSDPDVRIEAVKMLAESNDSGLTDDLIRAHSVENYTPVHNEYGRVLRSLTRNRNVRGKGAWKSWLANEVKAGRLKIEYLPINPDSNHQSKILSFALKGPDDFDEMATALTAEIYDRRICHDALRYMVFNDNLPDVQKFLVGDWLHKLFSRQNININDIGYFLNGLANPGHIREQINNQVCNSLDSDNPIVVANALNLIAGVKGYLTRFLVPDVEGKVEKLLSSSVPEVAVQAQRAMERIRPGEKRQVTSEASKVVSGSRSVLQRMIDSAQAEATIIIPKGVYTEPVTVTKPLTLKGESRNDCIFEVTSNQPAISVDTKGKGRVIIEAVTIKWQLATSDRTKYPFAVAVKDTIAEVKNCSFQPLGNFKRCPVAINAMGFSELNINNCRFKGFEYTVCFGQGTKGMIRNSLVVDSGHQGISLYSGATAEIIGNVVTGSRYHAVRSTGGTLNMTDNLIINNANRGVYLGNKSARGTIANNVIIGNGTGIGGFAQTNVKVENNIIADSSYAGIGFRDSCSLSIRDNIFRGNERGWILFKEGGTNGNTVYKNTFWQNKVDAENMDKTANSIVADPAFTDAQNGDFSLKPGPALQQKQGLTNPEIFKKLWKIWKNREEKNVPATGN